MKKKVTIFKVKGFTLIEFLLVIVIIGILVTIVVLYSVLNSINSANKAMDLEVISELNLATRTYAIEKHITSVDIFTGIGTDSARMQALVTNGDLRELVTPLQKNYSYSWDIQRQLWQTISGVKTYNLTLSSSSIDTFRHVGTWNKVATGFQSSQGLLFIENKNETYTISTIAQLGTGTRGGYGILFDTSLSPTDQDTGYALQFDRGTPVAGSYGAIIIRRRVNGNEFNPSVVASNADSPIIPTNPSDPWWSQVHNIELSVSKVANQVGKKQLSVWIDGTRIEKLNFIFASNLAASENYTGIRSWVPSVTTYSRVTTTPL